MELKDVISGDYTADVPSVVSGLLPNSGISLQDALQSVSKELESLTATSAAQLEAVGSNTEAVLGNTAAQSSGGLKGAASSIGKAASSFLSGGLGMIPIVAAVRSLFGGSESETATPVKYTAPAPIQIETSGKLNWGSQNGSDSSASYAGAGASEPAGNAAAASAPQITIQVQAMDSRSFMDHSGDIARAVREAMLNMHSLNDVINDG
jgi:hypothetical protein